MKIRKILLLVISSVVTAYVLSGCGGAKVIKSTDSAMRDKSIQVSDEEFKYWEKLAKEGKESADRSKGAFWAGQYFYNKKEWASALKYFQFNEKYYADVDWGYLSILRMFDICQETGQKDLGLEKLKFLVERRHQFSQFEALSIQRLDEMVSKYGRDDLKAVYKKHAHKVIDEYALYYLCKLDLKDSMFDEFFSHASAFLADFRDSVFYGEITSKYKESVKYKPVNNRKLGVIIPLSGKAMDIGTIVKSGLELAVSGYNEAKPPEQKVSMVYMDEENPKLVTQVVQAIENDGIIALIGPLYSKTVKSLIPIIERDNTVLFSSTAAQPELAGKSQYFFRDCATARGQAYATAKYIMENTAYRNIATIYSDNPYGRTLNDYFAEKFKALGGNMVRQVSYDPSNNDFQEQMVMLGGVNTILLKEKRANEKMKLDDEMETAGRATLAKVFDFLHVTPPDDTAMPKPTPDPNLKKISICLLHMSPRGEDVRKFQIDEDMTKKLSYTLAKSSIISVIKQKACDDTLASMGVDPEDIDRDIALSAAQKMDADIIVWGKIIEAKTATLTANFLPETVADEKGNSKVVYNFTEDDYFHFKINIYVMSVSDETVLDEISIDYRKVKDPKKNPITLDALYIPSTDRKMVLIKDQLKFYDFNLPTFGSSALQSNYIEGYKDSVDGTIYPIEFYADDTEPAVQDFVKKYREKYANQPDVISASSYDLMRIMCTILDTQVVSRENFKSILSTVRNYQGVTGLFSFDASNDSIKEYYMMQISKDGVKFLKKVTGE